MSKLLTLFLASLPILILGIAPKEDGLYLTFVTGMKYYVPTNSSARFQSFLLTEDKGWVFGQSSENDFPGFAFTSSVSEKQLNSDKAAKYLFSTNATIRCITFEFADNNKDGRLFVVDGGVGENFASVVVRVPAVTSAYYKYAVQVYFNDQ